MSIHRRSSHGGSCIYVTTFASRNLYRLYYNILPFHSIPFRSTFFGIAGTYIIEHDGHNLALTYCIGVSKKKNNCNNGSLIIQFILSNFYCCAWIIPVQLKCNNECKSFRRDEISRQPIFKNKLFFATHRKQLKKTKQFLTLQSDNHNTLIDQLKKRANWRNIMPNAKETLF